MKNLLLLGGLLLSAASSFAQPKLTWQNCYGGIGAEDFYDVKRTVDGGYIIAGDASSASGDVTGPLHGGADAWIIKTDSNGAPQWNKAIGGTGTDFPLSICATPDSGYLVPLWSGSADGDMSVGGHGQLDCWVAKLTATGSLSWIRSYGGSGSDWPAAIVPTPDGNYIMAATSTSADGDISGAKGGNDIWIVKISPAGNIIWERSYGGTGNESANKIAVTPDGGFIICGLNNYIANGDVTTAYGMNDMWIVKTDSNGNMEWQKTVGGSQMEAASRVISTFDGGYVTASFTTSNDFDVTGYQDSSDVLIAKLSSNGTLLWAKAIGTVHLEAGNRIDVKQTRDSNLIILAENKLYTAPNYGSYGLWLAVTDKNGDLTSDLTLGGSKDDRPGFLEMISDSVFIIACTTSSTDGDASGGGLHTIGGPFNLSDGWLLKVKIPVTLSVETLPSTFASVKVYPTLVTSSVNVVFDATATKKRVTLVNSLGQVVADHPRIDSERISIPFSSLAAGTYFLKVMTGEQVTTHKIIYQP